MKEEIYNFFKSICSLQGPGRASAYNFRKNADMVASIYETFSFIEKNISKSFQLNLTLKSWLILIIHISFYITFV